MRNGLLQIADEIQPDKACIGTALSGFRRMLAVWKRMISHGAFCLSTAVYCGGWKKPARQHGIGIPNRNSAKTDFNTKGDWFPDKTCKFKHFSFHASPGRAGKIPQAHQTARESYFAVGK